MRAQGIFLGGVGVLYRVNLPNDYFPVGAFVEDDDEDETVQEVEVSWENGRMRIGGFKGLVVPLHFVRPYLMAILKRGFDDAGAFATQRRAY